MNKNELRNSKAAKERTSTRGWSAARSERKSKSGKKSASKTRSKAPIAAVVCVFGIILIAYICGAVFFSSHFIYATFINNCDVSALGLDDAKQKLMSSTDGYTLTLEEHNNIYETIDGGAIELSAQITNEFDTVLENQSVLSWPIEIFRSKEYTLDEGMINYTYNSNKLTEIIDNLNCVDPEYPIEAKDASLIMMDGEFQIVSEDYSNVAHRNDLEAAIKKAIESQESKLNLRESGLYDEPAIKSSDPIMQAKLEVCNSIANLQISLIFGYSTEVIDSHTIANWIDVTENNSEYSMQIDTDAVKAYAEQLAQKYDTSGKPKQFAATRGEVIEITTGDYGWKLNTAYAAEKLAEIVNAKQSVTYDLTDKSEESNLWWKQIAIGYDANGNDYYGTSYAEVSISEQHMWLYLNGVLTMDCDVVTGNPTLGNDTPQGAFRIRYKELNATLRGPGYVTPVDYWMVFADDVGFHDATWQAAFGGDLYYTNGSHGCVNMSLNDAARLYDYIYDGLPVFVYY
ncbi:MAG: L,D-transpeptidase/peptidoglycan binding protein [Lachnospiraceae bacterium]|nr:L,D-transpeptidase/peptidoglycan binding protein [Lachnospiraceae bacterium]